MGNSYGTLFRFTIFGQSHAPAIGVTMEGLPSGLKIDMEELQRFLDRRAPGQSKLTTSRREADAPEFVAGLHDGVTCGAPVTAIIRNTNTRSADYEYMRYIPRPMHADYPAMVKYGAEARDFSGGGQFSGRLTAPLCIAGGVCKQVLGKRGIEITARIAAIGGETDDSAMTAAVESARRSGDSVGGVIECTATGLPVGVGEPMFGGLESRISAAVFGIPAVKGIEFGAGFAAAGMRGSEHNDPFAVENGKIVTKTNNHGGILGGISTGMPLVLRAAFKPTPSIAQEQESVDIRTLEPQKLKIRGRHDPCVVLRAVPCVEAAVAAAIYDAILEAEAYNG
ncbi:MAG: chorismate synthase [Oscillospiraceae bacterium]|nr:chorismate synthase [Oscillospiraceae bacterium]